MAEVLAVVASGIAVVQLASQLVSSIAKLKSLVDDIKNVPPMIAHLVQKLEIFVPLIEEVEMIQADFPVGTSGNATLQRCIQYCRTSSQTIAGIVTSLSQQIDSKKGIRRFPASLKITLSEKTLTRLEGELDKTMHLLLLAQQLYTIAVCKHNQELLASIHASTGTRKPDNPADGPGHQTESDARKAQRDLPSNSIKNSQKPIHEVKLHGVPRNWRSQLAGLTVRVQWATGTYHAQLVYPRWVASCAWDLQLAWASSGWRMAIRSHSVRPRDSQPFVYIGDGNLDGLLGCFKRGEASPFDQDLYGVSLAHYAALNQQVEICFRLFEMGVDINERTPSQRTVLRYLNSLDSFTTPSPRHIDLVRFLLSRGGEYDLYEGEPPEQQLGAHYQSTAEVFSLLQSHLFPQYYDDSLQTRLLCATQIALTPCRTELEFRVSLQRHGEISGRDVVKSMDFHLPILNLALLGLSIRLQSPEAALDVPNWQTLVASTLAQSRAALEVLPLSSLDTSHVTTTCTGQLERATPILCIVMGTLQAVGCLEDCWELMVSNSVQLWADTLRGAGMDIEQYSRVEEAYFKSESRHNWFHLGKGRGRKRLARLEHLSLGSEPESWDLTWNKSLKIDSGQGDIFSGSMPGAWVEDNLPTKRCSCH
ncbi:Ankyrin repeat-containing protein [Ilyonectria robusta]